jgi:hypothetical protein
LHENQAGICVGVKDTSSEFLKYLDKQGIALGSKIEIIGKESFDLSLKIKVDMRICPFRIKLPVIFCVKHSIFGLSLSESFKIVGYENIVLLSFFIFLHLVFHK